MSADGDIQDNSNHDAGSTAGSAGEEDSAPGQDGSGQETRRAEVHASAPGGVLPNKAAEDDPRRWGDQPNSYDHDAWLQEQKPPHWG